MKSIAQYSYTDQQVLAWLRGLFTIAWADGDFSPEEKALIAQITKEDLDPANQSEDLKTISPEELAIALSDDRKAAENFLRTGVLVAIADGVYSASEAEILEKFRTALGLETEVLQSLELTLCCQHHEGETAEHSSHHSQLANAQNLPPNLLHPVKDWLDKMEIEDPRVARFICKMVPPQCPFERDIKLFGHKVVHIPPLCKINPLYEQLVGLRFRALSYLADDCQEDVSQYI
ncbi:MAG: Mo-dependent nitrogenase C-terminal domain-containing protein [Prochloraceae cyanobacterium]|nr:Mo-dependent nitrogenase C-terminal domain-containing protein [Prochloraceae cyanobacterium]